MGSEKRRKLAYSWAQRSRYGCGMAAVLWLGLSSARVTCGRCFLTQHWDLIVAAYFFTIEGWTRGSLWRFVILFFMELLSRKVEIAGIASSPSGLWINQIGRNITNAVDSLLNGKRYLITFRRLTPITEEQPRC